MTSVYKSHDRQCGASLIEVLIAILLLSFGLLALGAMLSYAVQAPKMSNMRAVAANIAASHIERIRANPTGYTSGSYTVTMSYDGTFSDVPLVNCSYPTCDPAKLAALDNSTVQRAARIELPAGGVLVTCDTTPCSLAGAANLWIIWQEPSTLAALNPSTSDNCPTQVTNTYTRPKPRCLYVRFKI